VIRVVISGICGRMGSMVAGAVAADGDLALAGGIEIPGHSEIGRKLCERWGSGDGELRVLTNLGELDDGSFDVIVDFSTPAQAAACAEKASGAGKGLVVGTTGLAELQMAMIQEASRSCPVVVAPNTSIGVNLLFGLTARVASVLGNYYDIEIVEAHHAQKKDAPSGTALKLVEIIADARGLDPRAAARFGRSGLDAPRGPDEIGVHSIRAGTIVGRHSVRFISPMETVTLEHEAAERTAFAIGAVQAARFVHGRAPGLYDMSDVLGLRDPPAAPGGDGAGA